MPIVLLRPEAELAYLDSQSVTLPVEVSAYEAWSLMTGASGPLMRLAFRVRDAISARFGVQRIGGFSGARPETIAVGARLDFFLVEALAEDLLVLTARDRHLDVMICLSRAALELTVTASVVTHNAFGRLYMLPVGLAHRVIVAHHLRGLRRRLAARQAG